ncbi:MAG: efflux RND transporter periplasmic adaptor subunit [Rhodothermales bacterium]|nr:efflux RND transporter periplasmic adaptor subunit [Rhodothermales bacterium]
MIRISGFLLTLLLVIAATTQLGCGNDAKSMDADEDKDSRPAVPVEVAAVVSGDISAYLVGTATLEAEEQAMVVSKSGGIVEQIFAEEGNYVKAGQKLAQLDDERLALEVDRAEASLQKLAREFERNEELYEKQLVSSEEYERVRSEYEAQKAARDLARLSLDHTTVIAPITGIISQRLIKVGNMVQAYEPTFQITDFDPLHAIMHVPERELNKLTVGHSASLKVDAYPSERFTGRIKRISPVLDPATGTFKVTVEVRDSSKRLKPGMFTRIRIVYDTHDQTLLVPKEAVLAEDDESTVFVIRDSMTFRQVVRTGYEDERFVEILDGLDEGSQVITTGQSSLKDSARVEIVSNI